MITNSIITIYHKNIEKHKIKWSKNHYNAWFFGGKGSSTNKGYEKANDCQIRIPYDLNENLNLSDFQIADIILPQEIDKEISSEEDLKEYVYYNITSITNNQIGNNKHIHLSGK